MFMQWFELDQKVVDASLFIILDICTFSPKTCWLELYGYCKNRPLFLPILFLQKQKWSEIDQKVVDRSFRVIADSSHMFLPIIFLQKQKWFEFDQKVVALGLLQTGVICLYPSYFAKTKIWPKSCWLEL